MGDTQKLTPEEQIRSPREAYENGTDFTLAVEEEFAVLDPETLSLANRFEELQAAAQGTPLEEHLVGELIASEVEVRTGRCDSFAEAAAKVGERRAQLDELAGWARDRTRRRRHSPVEPVAGPAHHRHAALPRKRRAAPLRRLAQQHLRAARSRWHPRRRPRDRGLQRAAQLPARAAGRLGELTDGRSRVHLPALGAHRDLHAHVPALRGAGRLRRLAGFEDYVRFLYATGSITEHTQMWWSVRTHLAFPTVEIRICDAQPDLEESRSLAALCYALTARIARALDEGEPLPNYPHRLIEENFWRAIRYGLSGELIDLTTGDVRPARAHLERLLEWVAPVAEELGAAQYLAVPNRELGRAPAGAVRGRRVARRRSTRGLVRRGAPVRG